MIAKSDLLQKPKVLIVDDERLNITLLSDLLQDDYQILTANSGEEAFKVIAKVEPDLILLDVIMQGMDGYAVCRHLKQDEKYQHIPIIFITAKDASEDEARGFAEGAVDFIAKPFNCAVVIARVGTHVRLKQKTDLLERLAAQDSLTSIANRRAFDDARQSEWNRSYRLKTPISLLMIDVDMFKQFNDNYGHHAGDECLIQLAAAMAHCASRPADFFARYGGEEFAAILGGTTFEGALLLAENFRLAVHKLTIPHANSQVDEYVTISIGVASVTPSERYSVEALCDAADDMLYAAKAAGRNQVKGILLP